MLSTSLRILASQNRVLNRKCRRFLCTAPKQRISFGSDNNSGVHPKILDSIAKVNIGQVSGYGEDYFTRRAVSKFQSIFGAETKVHFVFNGTAANVLSFGSNSTWFNSVLLSQTAHVNVDEGGAPERIFGLKIVPLPSKDGKITPSQILSHTLRFGDVHHSQPRIVSITQATEYGTVYSAPEIQAIADVTHKHNMLLHMDGARISNAAAYLNTGLRQITKDVGVDLMSFGGTKNGMMLGEAVLFFRPDLGSQFVHIQKQTMQLASKMRFIAAQMEALLTDDLWLANANHANQMAGLLEDCLSHYPLIKLTQKRQANGIFATMPKEYIEFLQKDFYFYVWDEETLEVRLMCSFETQREHIQAFDQALKEAKKLYG